MPWPTAEQKPDILENPKWQQAMTKWQNIAEEAGPENSELARLINKHKLSGSDVEQRFQQAVENDIKQNEEVTDLLEDTFAGKSASTLNGRAGALLMYMRWTKSVNLVAFPLTEEVCYAYVKSCRIECAPATRAFEVRKAWRLATVLLGLDNKMDTFKSARIDGCIRRCYRQKRMTKRSTPLHKKAVMALERACVHDPNPVNRSKAGFLRFCIGARARGGDAARIGKEPELDLAPSGMGYIDVLAHVHER